MSNSSAWIYAKKRLLDPTTQKIRSVWLPGTGGSGANLSIGAQTDTTLDVVSDTGTPATIPAATDSLAGLLTAANKTKLDIAETTAARSLTPTATDPGNTSTLNGFLSWLLSAVRTAQATLSGLGSLATKSTISNIDVAANAAIDASKLNLSAPGSIGATTPAPAIYAIVVYGARPRVSVTASKTLGLSDAQTFQYCTNSSAATLTLPHSTVVAWQDNTEIEIAKQGAGTLSLTGGTASGGTGAIVLSGSGGSATAQPATISNGVTIKLVSKGADANSNDVWVFLGS